MALINCKDCGASVSTDARRCPKCSAVIDAPMDSRRKAKRIAFIAAIGLTVIAFGGGVTWPLWLPAVLTGACVLAWLVFAGLCVSRVA